jgi:DNA-binding transcriptional LysR family regulator
MSSALLAAGRAGETGVGPRIKASRVQRIKQPRGSEPQRRVVRRGHGLPGHVPPRASQREVICLKVGRHGHRCRAHLRRRRGHRPVQQAADDLSITQQAVSKRVAALEKDLGVRLFTRTARGARLTVDGQADRVPGR